MSIFAGQSLFEGIMSHIINKSGAETDLFRNLSQRGIHRFSCINDLFSFKKNYLIEIEHFREKKTTEVRNEIENLSGKIVLLRTGYEQQRTEQTDLVYREIVVLKAKLSISTKNLIAKVKGYFLKKRLSYLETHFDQIVEEPLQGLQNEIQDMTEWLSYLSSHQQDVITKRSASFVAGTERTVSVLTELSPLIYGAIGELKAIELLGKLPDGYYVINDYQRSFHSPLHMKSEDEWIYSIQLDHVVVGPTGVFVIETKYWSPKSIKNNNLFSPVKQLRRGGFALFVTLNNAIREYRAFNNHWGSVQVPVANILLMMNATTNEQFQFVKILTESNLLNHITNRPVTLTNKQVKCLVDEML
jgi:hypothetical protein